MEAGTMPEEFFKDALAQTMAVAFCMVDTSTPPSMF